MATSALPKQVCRINAGDDQLSSSSEFGDETDDESSGLTTPSISSDDELLSEPEAELDMSESDEVSDRDEPGNHFQITLF